MKKFSLLTWTLSLCAGVLIVSACGDTTFTQKSGAETEQTDVEVQTKLTNNYKLYWELRSPGDATLGWVGKHASLAKSGERLFTSIAGGSNNENVLFDDSARAASQPVWVDPLVDFSNQVGVDAARDGEVYGHLRYKGASYPKTAEVRIYQGDNGTPIKNWVFPFAVNNPDGDALVSDGGERAVVWLYDNSSGEVEVAVFDPAQSGTGPMITYSVDISSPRAALLSGDGRILYLASTIYTKLIDVDSGTEIFSKINWSGVGNGHAINADGSRFVESLPSAGIRYYERSGSSYIEMFTHTIVEPHTLNHIAISDDGLKVALAFDLITTWKHQRLQLLEVLPGGYNVDFDRILPLGEELSYPDSHTNSVSDLEVSAAGDTIAIATWGDDVGAVHEVQIFKKLGPRWELEGAINTQGSPNDIDLSADGNTLGVAAKGRHANDLGGGGTIALFRRQ